MYQINEISNRDIALLHYYRILRQPADFLSAVFTDEDAILTEIYEGNPTEFQTDDERALYSFELGINQIKDKIPYLEFDTTNDLDRKNLESLLYLNGTTIYGVIPTFKEPIQIRVYWVSSLADIQSAIDNFIQALSELGIDDLRQALADAKNKPKGLASISGRDENLIEFVRSDDKLTMQDSDYMITSALDSQMLVNPSQELLMSLPRVLRHSINISITDGGTRYLASYSGCSLNIRGNGNWLFRDVSSDINLISGSGFVKIWNCSCVHIRTSLELDNDKSSYYTCTDLYAHHSFIILNQGVIQNLCLVGGSVFLEVPTTVTFGHRTTTIENISLIGYGCSFYSWSSVPNIPTSKIQGLAWWFIPGLNDTALYIAGRRIDEISGEHDREMQPTQIVEYNVDNIHIHTGGD